MDFGEGNKYKKVVGKRKRQSGLTLTGGDGSAFDVSELLIDGRRAFLQTKHKKRRYSEGGSGQVKWCVFDDGERRIIKRMKFPPKPGYQHLLEHGCGVYHQLTAQDEVCASPVPEESQAFWFMRENKLYFSMPAYNGPSLYESLQITMTLKDGWFVPASAAKTLHFYQLTASLRWLLVQDLLTQLAALHDQGSCLIDIKASNVMLHIDKGRIRLRFIDFDAAISQDMPRGLLNEKSQHLYTRYTMPHAHYIVLQKKFSALRKENKAGVGRVALQKDALERAKTIDCANFSTLLAMCFPEFFSVARDDEAKKKRSVGLQGLAFHFSCKEILRSKGANDVGAQVQKAFRSLCGMDEWGTLSYQAVTLPVLQSPQPARGVLETEMKKVCVRFSCAQMNSDLLRINDYLNKHLQRWQRSGIDTIKSRSFSRMSQFIKAASNGDGNYDVKTLYRLMRVVKALLTELCFIAYHRQAFQLANTWRDLPAMGVDLCQEVLRSVLFSCMNQLAKGQGIVLCDGFSVPAGVYVDISAYQQAKPRAYASGLRGYIAGGAAYPAFSVGVGGQQSAPDSAYRHSCVHM